MEDSPTYDELAEELLRELVGLVGALTPVMVNSTRGETATLMTLSRAGAPMTPGQLGEHARVSSARVANILRALEEKGLVTRTHSAADRRSVEVSLTDAGRAEAERIRAERTKTVARYLSELGTDDATQLLRIVGRTVDILRDRAAREGAAR